MQRALEWKKNMGRPPKVETLKFDGADKCFVCEAIDSAGLKFVMHPALPMAICARCQTLTPMDFVQEKDLEKKKRIALVLGAPVVTILLKRAFPKLFDSGRPRRKRR